MGTITADEMNFQQLLDQSEKLCSEDVSFNIFKLGAALNELEKLYNRLQRNRRINGDILRHYGQSLQTLRHRIEGKQKAHAATSTDDKQNLASNPNLAVEDPLDHHALLKAKSKSAHHVELREQLFGETNILSSSVLNLSTEEIDRFEAKKQENLANELFGMARLMKQTYTSANAVIKEDNATLSRLQTATDNYKESLLKEGKRLEEHAYRSWCDCLYIVGVCAIFSSFIAMVLIMRIFSKKQ